MRYADWLNEWLEHYVKPVAKIRTYERYVGLSAHIGKRLGNLELKELSPIALQKFVTDVSENGNMKTGKALSPNTVNAIISVLQNSLKTAFSIGLTDTYIGDRIRCPSTTEKTVECFSLQEQKRLETAVLNGKKSKLMGIIICLYTGLRIGELLSLEWRDIDFAKNTISVSKSCHYGHDKDGNYVRFTEPPKTSHSIRKIPVPKQLMPILRTLKKNGHSEFVIAEDGRAIAVRSYQRSFELLQKKLNIKRRGFHALRHTFATRAIECGMDVKTLSEILGHKNSTITLNRYAHSLLEHKINMMNRIGKLL